MPELLCTACRTSVPLVGIHVTDMVGSSKIGPCCIVETDEALAGADFSALRFLGIIDQRITRVNSIDAKNMIGSYRAAHPAASAPEPPAEDTPPPVATVPETPPADPAPARPAFAFSPPAPTSPTPPAPSDPAPAS